jgi:hypothetical protein
MTQRHDRSSLVYVQRFNVKAGLPHLEVRSIVFFVGLLVVVSLAGWLYLHQASEVAACVQQIRKLQNENKLLQQEILALHADVAMLGSLKHVQELATAGNYQPPETSDSSSYLLLPYQPSSTPNAPITGSAAQAPAPLDSGEGGKGLGQRLMDQLKTWMGSPAR